LIHKNSLVVSTAVDSLRRMAMPASESFAEARSGEPLTLTALLLERIALRHKIAVLQAHRNSAPVLSLLGSTVWILFSRWWPHWRDSLIIVQPETVLRWPTIRGCVDCDGQGWG
jgi:hypothetical protein